MIETLMKMPLEDAMEALGWYYCIASNGLRTPWHKSGGARLEISNRALKALDDVEKRVFFTYSQNENERSAKPGISEALVTIRPLGFAKSEYPSLRNWEIAERSRDTDACRLDGVSMGGDGSGSDASITFSGYLREIGQRLIEMSANSRFGN